MANVADAWQIVAWYKRRWIIEQFFRSMKTQGLRIEDSQLETAEGLIKLVAIAAKAATIVIQLVQARQGENVLPADFAFSPEEIEVLDAINKDLQGKTELQKNRIAKIPSPGLHGSSPSSVDGADTLPTSRQDPLHSTPAWLVSKLSLPDGLSNMCRCPSAKVGEDQPLKTESVSESSAWQILLLEAQ